MIKKLIFFILVLIVIETTSVESSILDKGWYWPHQTIDYVREYVELKDKTLYIELDAVISIDNTILNESDWITFTFSPVLYDTDKISSFKSSVGLQREDNKIGIVDVYTSNKKSAYIENVDNFRHTYNVSLKSLKGRNTIIFSVNYTINNRVFRIKDFTYGFFYQSRADTLNHNIYFRFPNNLEFTHIKNRDKLKQGSGFQDYEVMNDETKEVFNFVFEDVNEKKIFELKEKKLERILDITLIVIGAIVGLLLTVFYEKISYRNKKLFGNIEIQKFKGFRKVIIKVFKK